MGLEEIIESPYSVLLAGFILGVGGNILSNVLYNRYIGKSKGNCYDFLRERKKRLKNENLSFYFPESSQDNYEIANDIFGDKRIESLIAIAFNEDPNNYGDGDLMRLRVGNQGASYRIVPEEICNKESQSSIRNRFEHFNVNAELIVVPKGTPKISWDNSIHVKFADETYLSFKSKQLPSSTREHSGYFLTGEIAQKEMEYWRNVIDYVNNI